MVRTTIKDLEVANREFTIDSKAAIVTLIRPEDHKGDGQRLGERDD